MNMYFVAAGYSPTLTIFPRKLLPTTGLQKIGDIGSVLAVEEDELFPDPLLYLKEEV